MRRNLLWLCGILELLLPGAALAQERRPQERPPEQRTRDDRQRDDRQHDDRQREEKKLPPVEDNISQTKHSVRIAGQEIKYAATAGTLVLRQEDGTPRANIFYVAYTRDDATEPTQRPITFTFNGGPGSSSAWLHMGAFGPKRVRMDDEGFPLPPPYRLVDNEYSPLDVTDLVFIDPVTTGYSRAIPGEKAKEFHGVREDVEAVAEFIRLYLTRNKRWGSPKFLAGESYGTTRAAALSGYLQQHDGIFLNGIVLISTILNFETVRFDTGNDLPYILFLPAYTATAWYHKKLAADLQADLPKAIDQAEQFARNEYTLALMAGDTLAADVRTQVAEKLARYTGLPREYIERANLRVSIARFTKELLRGDRRTVGRLDSRFTGIDSDAVGEHPDYDPSYAAIQGPFTATVNDYLRSELKFESDLPYEVLTARVQPWSFAQYENRYVNVADALREAMSQNRSLKVYVAKGYYDLATPFFAADYTMTHLGLDPMLQKNISGAYYQAGHMIYIHKTSLEKLKRDVAQFIRSATSP